MTKNKISSDSPIFECRVQRRVPQRGNEWNTI